MNNHFNKRRNAYVIAMQKIYKNVN